MSDAFYRERAARRTRRWVIIALIIGGVACLVSSVVGIYYDNCTASFNRQPEHIITSFVAALGRGDPQAVVRCWDHYAYMDIAAGCSEICLSRLMGTQFRIQELQLDSEQTTDGRNRRVLEVRVACQSGDTQHVGQITLDSIGTDVPWRHWKIIHSTFGGPLSDLWCQE